MSCLFCKIVTGEIPSTAVYEDASSYAFADLHPQAPVHLLIVPRKHIPSMDGTDESHRSLLGLIRCGVAHRGVKASGRVTGSWSVPEKTAGKPWIISTFTS